MPTAAWRVVNVSPLMVTDKTPSRSSSISKVSPPGAGTRKTTASPWVASPETYAPEAALQLASLELPPPRREGRIVGEGVDAVPELVRLLREEAKVL